MTSEDAMEVKAEYVEVPRARARIRDLLRDWELIELIDTAELLATELLSNAIEHTGSPARLRLAYGETLRIEVSDASAQPPRMCHPEPESTCGRGLELIDLLADRWSWRPHGSGKTVWAELSVRATTRES